MFNVVYSCMNGLGKTETFHRKMKPLICLSSLSLHIRKCLRILLCIINIESFYKIKSNQYSVTFIFLIKFNDVFQVELENQILK